MEQAVKSGDMSISTANEVAKLAPEKQQEIISEKPQISHKEVKKIQRQENTSADAAPETDEEEDEGGAEGEGTVSGQPVVLSDEEAEALSEWGEDHLSLARGEDFKVLRKLADRL